MKKIDLTGMVFGNLKVLKLVGKSETNKRLWLCECSCGKNITYSTNSLCSGRTKSCGCKRRKHGMCHTKEYRAWVDMKSRCFNKNNRYYKDYGGRGISVDKDWFDYENFFRDIGKAPTNKSLDRINNNGNYNKKNCRWADTKTQANNKRSNVLITAKGMTRNISQWAMYLKINRATLYDRLFRGKKKFKIDDLI
jgi:hypothetical protein